MPWSELGLKKIEGVKLLYPCCFEMPSLSAVPPYTIGFICLVLTVALFFPLRVSIDFLGKSRIFYSLPVLKSCDSYLRLNMAGNPECK